MNMVEENVTKVMLELGVPAHLRGYQYMRTAIAWCVEDMERVGSVTKLLYPELAKYYQTTSQKVERAIRNAVEVSWGRGNEELFDRLFGYSPEDGNGRPTNSEYIGVIADYIQLMMRENSLGA